MPDVGPAELIIILVIILLLFGANRVSDLAGALGKSVREFRRGVEGVDEEPKKADTAEPKSS